MNNFPTIGAAIFNICLIFLWRTVPFESLLCLLALLVLVKKQLPAVELPKQLSSVTIPLTPLSALPLLLSLFVFQNLAYYGGDYATLFISGNLGILAYSFIDQPLICECTQQLQRKLGLFLKHLPKY